MCAREECGAKGSRPGERRVGGEAGGRRAPHVRRGLGRLLGGGEQPRQHAHRRLVRVRARAGVRVGVRLRVRLTPTPNLEAELRVVVVSARVVAARLLGPAGGAARGRGPATHAGAAASTARIVEHRLPVRVAV